MKEGVTRQADKVILQAELDSSKVGIVCRFRSDSGGWFVEMKRAEVLRLATLAQDIRLVRSPRPAMSEAAKRPSRMVARDRIELSTLRFSVVCSTN